MSRFALTRREFLNAALLSSVLRRQAAIRNARLVGTLPLGNPGGGRSTPLGRLLGTGLDARMFTDLSTLSSARPETLVTPNDRYYIRTASPSPQPPSPNRLAGTEVDGIDLSRIDRVAAGPYVMECAGNSDPANFGLISAARWEGYPMAAILDRFGADARRPRVLVEGADPPGPSATSIPGASWIFSRDQLSRALLADTMNGAPLPRDHGSPLRLIVPGWYGCACIKWVTRVDLAADDVPATSQMREFAARTHQAGTPAAARDYAPAVIDTAAMPIRVERWTSGGRPFYRIVGIIWGGSKPTNALSIRFHANEPWTRVEDCPLPSTTDTWSLWSHTWRPASPGRYQIVLRVDDPAIRTRRLDLFFYVREVVIDEV